MDVVIDLVGDFGHLLAGGDAGAGEQKLAAIDVDDFVDPGRGSAEEALGDGAEQRFVGGLDGVLAGLVDGEYGTARLEDAEVVAFDGEQGAAHDAFIDDFDGDGFSAQKIVPVSAERGDYLTCDGH